MSEKQLDMLIKIRDSYAMALDGITEYLQSLAPPESGSAPKGPCKTRALSSYDVNKIQWQSARGTKGPYEKTDGDNTPDYQALLKELQAHQGKMNIAGFFIWLFENQKTIGRKPR